MGANVMLLEKRRIFVTMDVSFHVDAPFYSSASEQSNCEAGCEGL